MKLIIGDLHFKAGNLIEGKALVDEIVKKVEETQPEEVVFLGDLLDNHATIHSQAFNLVYTLIKSVCDFESVKQVHILVGNHDYINNSQFCTTEHPYNTLKQWAGVTVVDQLTRSGQYIYVPYVPAGRFNELFVDQDLTDVKVIFAHQEFFGAVMQSQVGDRWDENHPTVISGHIHNKSWHQSNILYVGSPIQHSFGESNGKVILTMTDDLKMEFSSLKMPEKHTIEIDIEDVETLVMPEGKVRLKLRCNTASWAAFVKSKKYKELLQLKVKVLPLASDQDAMKKTDVKKITYMESLRNLAEQSGGLVLSAFNHVIADFKN